MPHIVLLRGVNVGGHRVFRPAQLPAQLPELGLVNIGAAGTFVVQKRVSRERVHAAFTKALPFATAIVICDAADIRRLADEDPLAEYAGQKDVTRFVTVLGAEPEAEPILPVEFKDGRRWLIRITGRTGPFALGVYRRDPKTIGFLGRVDRLFDVPVTTRNWNTIGAIAKVLDTARP
ncbi:MAG TPA: DUF1697 domain-containing protein [Gemmatimonadales bacterium]|nr:DUF1697 domain-containing protein [Gemmatimonadales bacterium]